MLPALFYGQTWIGSKEKGAVALNLNWYTSAPFIYQDEEGKLTGIEYEMMLAFQDFLMKEYRVASTLHWEKAANFSDILETIKKADRPNEIGVSAFSITKERKEFASFSNPYLPDITVLVTSQGTPIAETYEEFNEMIKKMEAITISGTIYEKLLFDLKQQLGVDFDIVYISSDQNVLDDISAANNRFGYIDLPIYLKQVQSGSDLTRQNFFTSKGTGYGFLMTKNSDWKEVFNSFLEQERAQIAKIISKYFGADLFDFMDKLNEKNQLSTSILTKEKELQLSLIKNANLQLEKEETQQRFLVVGIILSSVFIILIARLYIGNRRTTHVLAAQKEQIEKQQLDIEQVNELLIDRNAQLMTLNEEKSNLVQILAHDLRSPLNQITALADLLKDQLKEGGEEEQLFIAKIHDGARRLSNMISKILNVQSLDEGQDSMHIEEVEITSLLNEIYERYRVPAEKKHIRLELIPCSETCLFETDHLLLQLVMENLVSNAIKFSEEGTTVTITAEKDEDTIQFIVKDQGPGFTDEDKALMFNRFQKLSAQPTAGEPSTGLGLSIVKKYVHDLNGNIQLESEEGRGSTFYVQLKRNVAQMT